MGRVTPVFKPDDFPAAANAATQKSLSELFEHLCPGQTNPELPKKASALATVARNPRLALLMVNLSEYLLQEMSWTTQNPGLHQLAGEVLDLHFRSHFSFEAHIPRARAAGIGSEQQALLPFWRTTSAFNDEQRLVIEYALSVAAGETNEDLFSRVVKQYGEQGAIEFTVAIAWWSVWSMITNATGAQLDFGYGKPGV
jgi:alkylhydroperoxidase family enzyme